jgi:hypothetical protein
MVTDPNTTVRSEIFSAERSVARVRRYPDPLPTEGSGISTIRGQGDWGPAEEQQLRAAWVSDPKTEVIAAIMARAEAAPDR